MEELRSTYGKHGFEILGIAVDTKDHWDTFFKHRDDHPTWPSLLDPEQDIVDGYGIEALGTYVLVDEQGLQIAVLKSSSKVAPLLDKHFGLNKSK